MRSSSLPPVAINMRLPLGLAQYVHLWDSWREPLAGALIVIGLCGAFVFPSLLPVRWWMSIGLAIAGGFIRQQPSLQPRGAIWPLWAFFAVLMLYTIYAMSFHPLSDYGQYKVQTFCIFGAAAFLSGRRQAPLTEAFAKGMRSGLFVMLALSLLVVYRYRDLFMNQQTLGIEMLKETISVTMLPLVVAVGLIAFIPKSTKPLGILLMGALFLAGAALEVFIRGRFDAAVLCALGVFLVISPPWQHLFWRMLFGGMLALLGIAIYVNVLPLLGDSFLYLTWLDTESVGGRGPLLAIALKGFLAHPLGQGIGSFETSNIVFRYPHNIIAEMAYELGVAGLASMLAIYALTIRRIWQLWLSPPHRVLALVTFMIFAQMMKSGDLTTLAFHWVFLYLLVVCTPVATSWPLLSGREVV